MVILILGSPSDKDFAARITRELDSLGLPWEMHIASAHKVPRYLLDLLEKYQADSRPKVYITVAGRSNALSGMVDAQVSAPVIACPPPSDSFGGMDILSSLRMPGGVAPAVVLEPANAALLAAKILGLGDTQVRGRVQTFQEGQRRRLLEADTAL